MKHERITARTEIVVCDTVEALECIRPAWDDLLDGAERWSMTSAYPYVRCAWDVWGKRRGAKLAVICAWRGETLVGIWPLWVHRGLFGTIADHLGDGSTHQYAGPVLLDDDQAAQVADALFEVAAGLADVLNVQNLRVGTQAHAVVTGKGGLRRFRAAESPVVRLAGVSDWDDWVATRTKTFRSGLRVKRKRLAAQGSLAYVQMTTPAEARQVVEWLIATKQAQLKVRGLMRSHLWKPELREVWLELAEAGPQSGAMFHALTLNGAIIGACICVLGSDVLEFHYFAVDPDYAEFSLGELIVQECVTLAIQHGRDFDFRLTREAYKLRWAGEASNRYESVFIACNPVGRLAVACDALLLRADHHLEKLGYR